MAESYGVSPSSMGKINRWWQARKAAGQSVQPWELESMYEGEMNALGNQRTANRGLSLQAKGLEMQAARDAENIALQKRASDLQAARDAENTRMNNVNTQLRQDEISAGEKGQLTGALSNVGTTALMSYLLKSKNPSNVAPGAGLGATKASGIIPGSAEGTALPGNAPAGTFDTSMKGWNPFKNTGDPVNTTISEPIAGEGFAGSPAYQASENYIDSSLMTEKANPTASQVGNSINAGDAGGFGADGAASAALTGIEGLNAGQTLTPLGNGIGITQSGAAVNMPTAGAAGYGSSALGGASLMTIGGYAAPAILAAKYGMPTLGRTLSQITPGDPDSSNVFQQGARITQNEWATPIEAASREAGVEFPEAVAAILNPGGYLLGKAGTVICTELHRQGLLSDDILKYDSLYRARYISDDEYVGYRILAAPVVWLLRKSARFTRFFAPLAVATATEMASRANVTINGTMDGKVVLAFMVPLCGYVGRFIRYFGYPLSIFPKVKEV